MAYPTVAAPYGFKPVNLIGGQVYAGSTRLLPIQYGYNTQISFGDVVYVGGASSTYGYVQPLTTINSSIAANPTLGVFLGCTFTDAIVTKQKRFSQYWPAGQLAGDGFAYIADDPDIVMRTAVVTANGGSTIASVSTALIGQNIPGSYQVGTATTGDSLNGVISPTSTSTQTTQLFRIIDLVRDTSYDVTATGSSSTTTITLTGSGLPSAITNGAEVLYVSASTGQLVNTGTFVAHSGGYAVGTTSVAISATPNIPNAGTAITAIPAASTIVFRHYVECLVKFNFGQHAYQVAAATA